MRDDDVPVTIETYLERGKLVYIEWAGAYRRKESNAPYYDPYLLMDYNASGVLLKVQGSAYPPVFIPWVQVASLRTFNPYGFNPYG